jgi:hypothetical protein
MRKSTALLLGGLVIALGAGVGILRSHLVQQFDGREPEQDRPLGNPSSSSPTSPFRLDAEPVPVKMGDGYYAVPANVLDSPPEGKLEDGFYVDNGMLLVFLWPSMEGRTKENWSELAANGSRRVSVLVNTIKRGVEPQQDLRASFRAYALNVPGHKPTCADPLIEEECPDLYAAQDRRFVPLPDNGSFLHFERRDEQQPDDARFMSDIYLRSINGTLASFIICNRPTTSRTGTVCSLHFNHQRYWYKASFDFSRISIAESENLQSAVVHKLEQFEAAGEQLRKSTSGGSK